MPKEERFQEKHMLNCRRGAARRNRAFTLFEVLMVIVILGVLAALVIPQFTGTGERARMDLTKSLVETNLKTSLELFKTHTGRYPSTEEGLAVLVQRPDDEEIAAKWAGPYTEKREFKDAWGRELIYRSPGEYNEESYDLSSPGPNGQAGDDDDITNWQKR
jgi:general secretion pathway protein G